MALPCHSACTLLGHADFKGDSCLPLLIRRLTTERGVRSIEAIVAFFESIIMITQGCWRIIKTVQCGPLNCLEDCWYKNVRLTIIFLFF